MVSRSVISSCKLFACARKLKNWRYLQLYNVLFLRSTRSMGHSTSLPSASATTPEPLSVPLSCAAHPHSTNHPTPNPHETQPIRPTSNSVSSACCPSLLLFYLPLVQTANDIDLDGEVEVFCFGQVVIVYREGSAVVCSICLLAIFFLLLKTSSIICNDL